MKPLILILTTLALSSTVTLAQNQSRFDTWDKNNDGNLSREELPEPLKKNFSRVDTNQDGAISREEDQAFRNRAQNRNRPSTPVNVPGVSVLKDIPYANNDNPRQTLDLYLPENPKSDSLPLLVFIHGGGWRAGSKDGTGRRLALFIEDGEYAAASINYRLSDEAQWPAQIHDCKAALRFLRAHANDHGFDPDNIAVWGSSAGGHLVAMLGVSQDVEGLEGDIGEHTDQSSAVQAVINYYGPSELLTMDDHPGTMTHNSPDSPESRLIGGPIQENKEKSKNASPVTHAGKNDAPTLIVHGTDDPLVPFAQSETLDQLLDKAGVESILITVDGGGHGKGFPPSLTETIRDFLDRHLRNADITVKEQTLPATN
ncbi:MAG: alpha/beta hydrolase fold domain-containing protein [Verrucomicrobiota bacterium]